MKFCVLGAAFDTNNMGVSALAAGTLKCILHQFPDAEIIFLNYGKSGFTFPFQMGALHCFVRFVNMRFSKKFYLRNNIALLLLMALILKLLPFRQIRRKLIEGNPCLREIDDCDVIASIAGGDSFSDIYGMARLLYVSLPQLLVLLLRKKLVLLPQTIGPFKGSGAKTIARYILRKAALIYSRDDQGLRDVESLIGAAHKQDKLRFSYDVGFTVDPIRPMELGLTILPEQRKKGSVLVGLNVSGLLIMGGYNHKNMFGLKVEFEKLIYDLIDFLIQNKRATVLLIPHVFGNDGESDSLACKKIYSALTPRYGNSIMLAQGTYNQSEVKYIIGLCDFFIGARMHACIAALSQNIPAVPIAYSDKFLGVMKTVGVGAHVVDPRGMSEEEMFDIVELAFEQRTSIRRELEQRMPLVKQAVLTLFEDLSGSSATIDAPSARTVSMEV